MANISVQEQHFFTCPACDKSVMGRLHMAADGAPDIDPDSKTATLQVKIVGVDIHHSCVPKVTRSSHGDPG